MSAIWGAIDIEGRQMSEDNKNILRNAFDKCVIDRYEEKSCDNVYMGCGIQYFVPEAVNEKNPIIDSDIFFTADVVLDNRDELINKYHINLEHIDNMSDGELLYEIYKAQGKMCLNDLLGAYTFVWYDRKKNKVEIVLDAVGNRCLYYRVVDNVIYFSSLIEPLAKISPRVNNNDRWFLDFLAMDYLTMFTEAEETPLNGIYRIAPAQYIEFTKAGIKKETYWNVFDDFEEYKLSSDFEYKKIFNEIWNEAVKGTLRASGNVSILLSGGYDSTSVAAVAAPVLRKQGKKLYSYTSIPMKGYQCENKGYEVEDEREDVECTAQFYGNIETNYIDLDGKNLWELVDKEFEYMEMPFKSIQNFMWIKEAAKRAYKNNSRILLTGSYGNISISFSDLHVYLSTLLAKKKYIKLLKEIKTFSNTIGFSRSYVLKKIYMDSKDTYEENINIYRNSFVNHELANRFKTYQRLLEEEKMQFDATKNFEVRRKMMIHMIALRQIGEVETKNSLATGVLLRDPTKDKRVLEFCARLPVEQYCKHGIERRLVKVYLKDIMPPHVIDIRKKGVQSADLKYRFSLNWKQIREEWLIEYDKYAQSRYIDIYKAKNQLLQFESIDDYSAYDLTRHMYTILALRYENRSY